MADVNLGDYKEVAERIEDFRKKYPEGSLQCIDWRFIQAQGWEGRPPPSAQGRYQEGDVSQQSFIVYHAAAYRTPDDPRPGHGIAWEVFPGRTKYTRGSEMQNAETSAWGRAIIAIGASDAKHIASREEVQNRAAEDELHAYPPNSGKATRLRAVEDDDLDYSQPQDLQLTPEYAPGSIDSKQRNALHRQFARLGITDRSMRLKVCEGTLREGGLWTNLNHSQGLSTSNELSWHEADVLLKALREMKADG